MAASCTGSWSTISQSHRQPIHVERNALARDHGAVWWLT
jgi:hypothetical protein